LCTTVQAKPDGKVAKRAGEPEDLPVCEVRLLKNTTTPAIYGFRKRRDSSSVLVQRFRSTAFEDRGLNQSPGDKNGIPDRNTFDPGFFIGKLE